MYFLILLFLLFGSNTVAQMTDLWRSQIVSEHNRIRRSVGATAMYEVVYDMRLECAAQKYINTQTIATFQHNPDRSAFYQQCGGSGYVGENWYSGGPGLDDYFGGATLAWTDLLWPIWNNCSERQIWEASLSQTGPCFNVGGDSGHYTQVAWAYTLYVGCGYTLAGGTLCDYAPGGNIQYNNDPLMPYVLGTPCSGCPNITCDNGLCFPNQKPGQVTLVSGGNGQTNNAGVIAGSVIGVVLGLALIAGAVIGVYILLKRRKSNAAFNSALKTTTKTPNNVAYSPPNTDRPLLPTKELPPVPSYSPAPTSQRPLPGVPAPVTRPVVVFAIGANVFAEYSVDKKQYRGVVEQKNEEHYLIRWVDFGNDREWVHNTKIRKA